MFPLRDTTPNERTPLVTLVLIMANAAVFLRAASLPGPEMAALFDRFGVIPARYTDGIVTANAAAGVTVAPFFTSMFLHAGWLHIISNMWILWIFGDNVEDRMGRFRFAVFYLLCGLIAGVAHTYTNPSSLVPAVGASGAIAGVMGAYFLLFPRARVLTVVPIFFYPLFLEIPALVFMLFWFLSQFLSGIASLGASDAGGVAWWAHVGGFLAGLALVFLFARPRRRRAPARRDQRM